LDILKAIHFIEGNGTNLEKYRSNYLSAKRDDEISKDVLIIKRCIDRMTELKRENGSSND